MKVRQYVQSELDRHKKRVAELFELLNILPAEVGELEADSIQLYGGWLILRDESHKDLGARLATITNQSYRFKNFGSATRTAVFRDVGPFYKVDFDRPQPGCRKVRVLKPAQEMVLEICGDLPEGYKLLEELDESA